LELKVQTGPTEIQKREKDKLLPREGSIGSAHHFIPLQPSIITDTTASGDSFETGEKSSLTTVTL
jgi:hypothetical protein